jgi:hypothetical protein
METINTCSICKNDIDIQTNPQTGIEIWAEGHNAEPVNSGRCCSDCNLSVVIPARLSLAGKKLRNTNITIEEDDSEAWEAQLMLEKQRTAIPNATFKTHNDTNIEVNGTCLQGHVNAYYPDLFEKFGAPKTHGDGYKTDAEWDLEFEDGTVGTIYNWKNGFNYCGTAGTSVEYITEWNVGGRTTKIVDKIRTVLSKELRK